MSTTRISASEARERLSDLLNEVSVRGDRVVLERHGKRVAAMISAKDLDLLQALEDRYDLEEMRRVLAESDARTPWKTVKKKLGL
ncbi:MAG TPA: type II toxin-antitoxin system Phd/YefM family antitoxin [Gemmatimonadales bacterium]|nr:type II toxin-antitoxin system Phd/YefM family antitoxin [Gemmatimonadales bacterium]